MRSDDYTALFERIENNGLDTRLHWASGPRAGCSEPWSGSDEDVPGTLVRGLGNACFESGQGCVFAERLMGRPRLVILGAGHVGAATAHLGARLGFRVVVVDDRPEFANAEQLPDADLIVCDSFENALDELPSYANSYFVIVTRGHLMDQYCAERVLRMPFEYVGMMGSRRKVATVRQRMVANGFTEAEFDQIHAPIGLPLGGQEPFALAVSICAELIRVRSSGNTHAFDPDVQARIVALAAEPGRPAALATIIGHGGSTPRDTGARMLVTQDGLVVGSVGGGAVESAVITQCRELLATGGSTALIDYDMTDAADGRLGMICGGRARLLLESL